MLLKRVKWRELTEEPAIQICRSKSATNPTSVLFGIVSKKKDFGFKETQAALKFHRINVCGES